MHTRDRLRQAARDKDEAIQAMSDAVRLRDGSTASYTHRRPSSWLNGLSSLASCTKRVRNNLDTVILHGWLSDGGAWRPPFPCLNPPRVSSTRLD